MNLEQAFTGIKVLAVARVVAAPFAAYHWHAWAPMSTHRASRRGRFRTHVRQLTPPFTQARMAYNFLAYKRQQALVTLAISHARGQEVFRRMAASGRRGHRKT